jgi:hypothetical protein
LATVKADAHFVDCDASTGPGGSWTQPAFESDVATYESHLLKDGSTLKVMHGQFGVRLDTDGSAVDLGGGLVGLPSQAHGYVFGDTIRITGSTNYDATYALDATTTANTLVVTASYVEETFTGEEVVLQILTSLFGTFTTQRNADVYGDFMYIVGQNDAKTQCIGVVDTTDLTFDQTFFDVPPGGYGAGEIGNNVKVTNDGLFVYFITYDNNDPFVYKYNRTTGAFVWKYTNPTAGGLSFALDVDSSGRPYTAAIDQQPGSADFPCRIKADGSDVDVWYEANNGAGTISCLVDEAGGDDGYVFWSGVQASPDLLFYRFDLDGTNKISANIDGSANSDSASSLTLFNGFLYCFTSEIDYLGQGVKTIFKLNKDLEVVASAYQEAAVNLWIANDMLYVTSNSVDYSGDDTIHVYSLQTLDEIESINAGNVQNNVFGAQSDGFIEYGTYSRTTLLRSEQHRTVAYPQGYGHLEGQEIQVLADGVYLDDQTYTISSGAVSPAYTATVDHVGLQVVSKLQPMKIDGEVHVKKIRQIIPDVFESVGGEYGKELDDMYTMELRATNDIMERDNALYSGYVELPYKGQYDRSGDIWITQDIPLPLNVLGIGVRLSKEDI